jgi:hypothetical protein
MWFSCDSHNTSARGAVFLDVRSQTADSVFRYALKFSAVL